MMMLKHTRFLLALLAAAFMLTGLCNAQNTSTTQTNSTAVTTSAAPEALSTPSRLLDTFYEAADGLEDARSESNKNRFLREAEACLQKHDLTGFAVDHEAITKLYRILDEAYVQDHRLAIRSPELFFRKHIEETNSFAYFRSPLLEQYGQSIELIKLGDGSWRISKNVIDNINDLHSLVFPEKGLGGLYRKAGLEWMVERKLLTLGLHQWASLFLLIFVAVIIDHLFRWITRFISRLFIKKSQDRSTTQDTRAIITRVARPVGLGAAAWAVFYALPKLELPALGEAVLTVAAHAVAILAIVWASYRLVDLIGEYCARKAAQTTSKIDDLVVPLVRKTLKLFVTAAGLLVIADQLNLPIIPLLSGLGIGGLAFAFAAKDTIENFFGSVAVIADRPFEVGDWVNIDGMDGTVERLGFRSTRIRTFYNSLVTIPNSTLVRARVDNYGKRLYRRYKTTLNMTYDTPPDKLEAYCEGLRQLVRKHPYTRKDSFHIYVNDFGPSSIDILIYIFFRTPDWATELRERHRFILDASRLAQHMGVAFAFPTQTLHLHNDTELPKIQPQDMSRGDEEGLRAAGEAAADRVVADAEFAHGRPKPARSD